VHPSQVHSTPAPARSDPVFPAISTLYTHPQVWGQCGRFLSKHFPPGVVERIDLGSTSAAAALVAREGGASSGTAAAAASTMTEGSASSTPATIAAIGSRLAGQKHQLVCLAENIEDSPGENTTRFLVLRNSRHRPRYPSHHAALVARLVSNSPTQTPAPQTVERKSIPLVQKPQQRIRHKSLITFTIPHTKPGALADALAVFKTHGFNLTSIDTRPSRRRNWHYVFFVECEEASTSGIVAAGADAVTASDIVGTADTPGVVAGGVCAEENDDIGENMRSILDRLGRYTESLRYLGRFVDQLQSEEWG